MGIKQDVEESLKDYFITKIDGQPSEEAITKLKLELSEGLASIPTLNGGGRHGHIGLIIPTTEYTTFSHNNTPYDILTNPGPYPTTVDTDAVVRERQIAEHKAEIREYEMQLGVTSWARKAIVGAIDEEWISEIRNPHVGFNHLLPIDILTHLEAVGGTIDFMDVTELQAELLKPWDQVEAPTTLFERQDKIEKQLVKAGIPAQHELRLATALCWFQQSGEFDSALELWEAKPTATKTLSAFRVYIQKEFAKRTKRDKQTAKASGRGLANATADEEAELNALAMAEIVNAVTAQNNAQMEKMMDMFKASLEAMSNKQQGTQSGTQATNPKCPHCNLRHAKPDNCWELEKNASKRPKNWKPVAERKKKADDNKKDE
jgi:hypothetical protein